MKRISKLLILLLSVALLAAACAQSTPAPTAAQTPEVTQEAVQSGSDIAAEPTPAKSVVRVATLKGPTGMGMAYLMEQDALGNTAVDYEFTVLSSPDEIAPLITTGQVDIAAMPTNLAMVLYNKTEGGVSMAALNTLGVLYVLTRGDVSIESVADLKGKTIVSAGQGATPEYILNYILKANGLEVGKDVTVEYRSEHAEVASLLLAGEADIVLLPEPQVTSALLKDSTVKAALDITKEWEKVSPKGSVVSMGCVGVTRAFAQSSLLDTCLDELQESAEYTNTNPQEASLLIEKYGIVPAAKAAEKAIPGSHIVFVRADAMKSSIAGFFNTLFESNPKSLGGKLAGDDFYYGAQSTK